ncbi:Substance-K receptor [Mactra antiquata]
MEEWRRQVRSDYDNYANYYETYYDDTSNTTFNGTFPSLPYNYNTDYGSLGEYLYYRTYNFEEPVYFYLWIPLIILTTLTNTLVSLVLKHRRMRSATNVILIAIAISDSMTGLVTVPILIYAYEQREGMDLVLTENWCHAFMLVRYFFSRAFHTISIWLTVLLGLQRLISVAYPFKAQSIFSIRHTLVAILLIILLAPILHIYHLFHDKVDMEGRLCEWKFEKPCRESCAYLWLSVFLMHFIPCGILVVSTFSMIGHMREASKRMQESKMITNQVNIDRRNMESKRITVIVLAVVVVFLIPEVPFGIFLLLTSVYRQQSHSLLEKELNRKVICAYEILLVLTFQANFWIYVAMNRKFRRGLWRLIDPVLAILNLLLGRVGVHQIQRFESTMVSGDKVQVAPSSQTAHSRLSISHSFRTGEEHLRISRSNSNTKTNSGLEMRTYSFSTNNNQVSSLEAEKVESVSE